MPLLSRRAGMREALVERDVLRKTRPEQRVAEGEIGRRALEEAPLGRSIILHAGDALLTSIIWRPAAGSRERRADNAEYRKRHLKPWRHFRERSAGPSTATAALAAHIYRDRYTPMSGESENKRRNPPLHFCSLFISCIGIRCEECALCNGHFALPGSFSRKHFSPLSVSYSSALLQRIPH